MNAIGYTDLNYINQMSWREIFKIIDRTTKLKSPKKKEKASTSQVASFIS